ncbi:SF1B family DNA helicase RecD2 [Lichenibacterium dinghuense]|uniref:SF1B family DNA helicase RecD2 n=1 Tax=Lichenibacterium dinghuense TaxID=2895977 RepID=UPI001EFFEE42|nr:ATP-dependent RecD-like DNA helicase [Lichenibacterium sp. 6Y81]
MGPASTPASSSGAPRENLAGLVERVTFHNEENGFCVLRLKARGQRDLITVVGHAAMISAGEWVQAAGTWTNDSTHGLQFRASFLKATAPTTVEGIEKYLGSGMIRGIGPAYAKRLVEAFGEAVFDVIEADPSRLREVEGIGPVRARRIAAGWAEQKVVREIMLFLHAHGVGTSRAVRIYKTYGAEAVATITENPYRLARDIRGIGFKTADQVAGKLGIAKDAMVRVRAGVSYALAEAMDEGHCGLPENDLLRTGAELLEVTAERLTAALALELQDGAVVADTVGERRCVFLAGLYHAERDIAERLRTLAAGEAPWPSIDIDRAVPWLESRGGLTLAPSQREALRLAAASKALVITGGPGVGKTTLVNSILKMLVAKGVAVALCAPTGRAAKRLTESTGVEAKTIHRLLETDPKNGGFKRDEANPLPCDLLVVDETSMVDVLLMKALLRALPPRAALLLVGDVDQLPSVGPGQVLADVIGSGAVPVVQLTEVFRQAATSRVIVNAHRINAGQMPEATPAGAERSDFYVVDAAEPETAVAKVLAIVRERIPRAFGLDPVRDVQVLCPMNRGGVGARALNAELQKVLNPPGEVRVERFGWTYGPGDKVMQVENDYDKEVYNGDLGIVTRIDAEAGELVATFDGREVTYGFGELDELVLAYATTIHKAQGSEYPAVVIPVMTQHYTMLARNLLYTGVTRGKRLVVLVGQRKAIAMAVRNGGQRRRWSKLGEWLAVATAGARTKMDSSRVN